jgi:hypothetical protein
MLARVAAISCLFLVVAAPPAVCAELDAKSWRGIADTLETEASAASLSTAALIHLAVLKDEPKSLELFDRAATFAPTDPGIAWLALSVCGRIDGCNIGARSARLVDLDGGNAAAHYPALGRARQRKDPAAEDRALAAMADSGYFDVYWSRSIVRAVDTLAEPRGRKRTPLRGIQWASSDAVGWLAIAAIPPFSAAADTCKGERLSLPEVKARCRLLVEVMENGDTYVAQAIGRAIGSRVYDATDPQLARVEERKRVFRYASEMTAPHVEDSMSTPGKASAWLDRFRIHRRESDVYRAWLVDLGIPPDAPEDYVPKPAP